jgi:hypothetical protein
LAFALNRKVRARLAHPLNREQYEELKNVVEYYKQEIKRMVELSLMLVLAHLIGDFYSNPLLGQG